MSTKQKTGQTIQTNSAEAVKQDGAREKISPSGNIPEKSIRGDREDFDTAVYALWFGLSYGSILSSCALYKTLEELGKKPCLLQKPPKLWTDHYAERNNIAGRFAYENCCVLEAYEREKDREILEGIHTHVVGPDITWNYPVVGKQAEGYFFLSGTGEGDTRLAWGASFGSEGLPLGGLRNQYQAWLRRFRGLAVTDSRDAEILEGLFGLEPREVLDPVFLCRKEFYTECAERSAARHNEKAGSFFFCHVEHGDERKRQFLLRGNDILLPAHGSQLRCMIDINRYQESKDELGLEPAYFIRAEDYLYYLIHSDFVLTDSLCAVYFALIFEKPFAIMANRDEERLERIKSFLGFLGLEERLVILQEDLRKKEYLFRKPVRYSQVGGRLEGLRTESLDWLRVNLETEGNGDGGGTAPGRDRASAEEVSRGAGQEAFDGDNASDEGQEG